MPTRHRFASPRLLVALAAAAALGGCRAEVDTDDDDVEIRATDRVRTDLDDDMDDDLDDRTYRTDRDGPFDVTGPGGTARGTGTVPRTGTPVERPLDARDNAWGTGPAEVTPASDTDILGVLVVIDEHEVRANADSASRTLRTEVRDYARKMEREHGRHAQETRDLATRLGVTLADTPAVTAQRSMGDTARTSLAAQTGDGFEKAYLDAMVKDHEQTLAKIDAFLAGSPRAEIRTHLESTRTAVANHLEEARRLRGDGAK